LIGVLIEKLYSQSGAKMRERFSELASTYRLLDPDDLERLRSS
jgi:hypothetical protein